MKKKIKHIFLTGEMSALINNGDELRQRLRGIIIDMLEQNGIKLNDIQNLDSIIDKYINITYLGDSKVNASKMGKFFTRETIKLESEIRDIIAGLPKIRAIEEILKYMKKNRTEVFQYTTKSISLFTSSGRSRKSRISIVLLPLYLCISPTEQFKNNSVNFTKQFMELFRNTGPIFIVNGDTQIDLDNPLLEAFNSLNNSLNTQLKSFDDEALEKVIQLLMPNIKEIVSQIIVYRTNCLER